MFDSLTALGADILSKIKYVKAAYDKFAAGEYASFVDSVGDLFKVASQLLKDHTALKAVSPADAGDTAWVDEAQAELAAVCAAAAPTTTAAGAAMPFGGANIPAIIALVMEILSIFKAKNGK